MGPMASRACLPAALSSSAIGRNVLVAARRSRKWHDPKPGQAPLRQFIRLRPPYLGRSQARTRGLIGAGEQRPLPHIGR